MQLIIILTNDLGIHETKNREYIYFIIFFEHSQTKCSITIKILCTLKSFLVIKLIPCNCFVISKHPAVFGDDKYKDFQETPP